MKALCWYGKRDLRVMEVPEPEILGPRDAIVQVSLSAVCGSDLHLYNGHVPSMERGDILGHEFVGTVVDVGAGVEGFRPGDRVAVPFTISCGRCFFCEREMWSLCDNSNPNAYAAEALYGYSPAGIYGYSHLFGGYAGGQAEYVRVPFADSGLLKLPEGVSDEKAVLLCDVFPTGYMAAENCSIQEGDTVAVWGAGPVGLLAMKSAFLLGAERVIAIDRFHERLGLASRFADAVTLNYEDVDVDEALRDITGGMGPDACIDAVGMEAHGKGHGRVYDAVKNKLRAETDRPTALRQAILACRKGGTVSIAGAYAGYIDKVPVGAAFNKGITIKGGQTHVQKYMPRLLDLVEDGKADPSDVITHSFGLEEGPVAYEVFKHKEDGCVKVVLRP
ncbi:MAG: glutathione-dependent formaldehyde dehydrogenase [Deltaproteobacteria bacterium]|nr:glutathione-dependent formaldehyde dehydrogenase [Deltaproteobacteria bacterium]MCL4874277.1 glutathione-dependent formaldehyde dehydrogenase [bacterium]